MSLKISQEYMNEEVVKPIMMKFAELEKRIKQNEKFLETKLGWILNRLPKKIKKK